MYETWSVCVLSCLLGESWRSQFLWIVWSNLLLSFWFAVERLVVNPQFFCRNQDWDFVSMYWCCILFYIYSKNFKKNASEIDKKSSIRVREMFSYIELCWLIHSDKRTNLVWKIIWSNLRLVFIVYFNLHTTCSSDTSLWCRKIKM
jgi:hypothetical protein